MARSRRELDLLIRSLYTVSFAVAALLASALGLLVHFSIRHGLRPLDEIGHQVETLGAERLDLRIRPRSPTLELTPVVERLNALLARLQVAFERERRFSSDIAHELRTPLAELRSLAGVGARWPEDRGKLSLILSNLFSNAIAYSPAGSAVSCSATLKDGKWEVTIANPAPLLEPGDLPLLFERFWRKDPARADALHAGLGLPLAKAFAELLGLALTAELDAGGRLVLRLSSNAASATPRFQKAFGGPAPRD
jgi:signal transduction histidine kinase